MKTNFSASRKLAVAFADMMAKAFVEDTMAKSSIGPTRDYIIDELGLVADEVEPGDSVAKMTKRIVDAVADTHFEGTVEYGALSFDIYDMPKAYEKALRAVSLQFVKDVLANDAKLAARVRRGIEEAIRECKARTAKRSRR